jgi:hypothetical protein
MKGLVCRRNTAKPIGDLLSEFQNLLIARGLRMTAPRRFSPEPRARCVPRFASAPPPTSRDAPRPRHPRLAIPPGMYGEGDGVPQDYVQAYMWFDLAVSPASDDQNAEIRDIAIESRDIAAAKMTPTQIKEAQRIGQNWTQSHPPKC